MRHLLICHDKDAPESLINVPEYANRYLAKAYKLIAEQGAETDCPPLFNVTSRSTGQSANVKASVNNNFNKAGKKSPLTVKKDNGSCVPSQSFDTAASFKNRDKICNYIHRTASIKAQGNMTTCGIYHAAKVGDFNEENSFWSLWNGEVMRGVRRDINTTKEWEQCKHCRFREARYRSQREKRAQNDVYSLLNKTTLTREAWDYRR